MRMLFAATDHSGLLRAAIRVAAADGLGYLPLLLGHDPDRKDEPDRPGRGAEPGSLESYLLEGTVDADYPASGGYVLHLYHFHHPWTHRGYGGWHMSAQKVTQGLVEGAVALWGRPGGRGRSRAVYNLGRACHLLADCWIPYHAAGVAGCGHGPYEAWLKDGERWREYTPSSGGRYSWRVVFGREGSPIVHALDSRNIGDWVDLASHESHRWYVSSLNGCRAPDVASGFAAAAAALVPGAVTYLAGFLHSFFTLAREASSP